ncbi:HNH endonuclease [Glutamicibacter sp. JL.03c]|uniref:HNH endonuclease signature motif containing protein n=1 Tax=Glutamicibacter sp. JL.03c TaxID=2984842 RepID=UPI0021F77211|nr:HNH endonuclease signature motif containing protein [Glutamicibacter sp. JL.03c]UYQ78583.1 HNH endonuclease [Glutamicibacter sp. JL.03c]
MDLQQLAHSLTALAGHMADQGSGEPAPSTPQLLQAQAILLQLIGNLSRQAEQLTDPRAAVANAQFAEALGRQATRGTVIAASLVETTGAHALHLDELDDLRAGRTDFSAEPRLAAGRTVYPDAASLLAAVLDLNYFDAARRVEDAHLVHARRDSSGTACAPRFTALAGHFAAAADPLDAARCASAPWAPPDLHHVRDPREVLKTARALNKFEPADTTFDGIPTSATATAADGTLLEEQAAALLAETPLRTRQKQLNTLVKDYKEAHSETRTPPLGLFRGRVVNGVHEFIVRVRALDAELWNSLIAQADNKRTRAGAAARQAAHSAPPDEPERSDDPEPSDEPERTGRESSRAETCTDEPVQDDLWHSDEPIPDWARGPQPAGEGTSASPSAPPEASVPIVPTTCTVPERRLNALNAILRNIDPNNSAKRITPEIVVHASYQDLADLASISGITAHGVKLSAPELRTMLCEAKVLSPIYNADGVIMDIGRDARLFPRWMKLAARDRDGGCLVPGCTEEPALLEYHHFMPWSKGGHTRLQDCCPLCTAHHVMVHAGHLKMVKIRKLPYVILPKHLDPDQRPQRNTYFARSG